MKAGRVWVLFAGLAVASAWTASAVSSSSGPPLDVATKGFGLHMKLTLPRHWQVLPSDPNGPPPTEAITLVHVGTPPTDESLWWGPDIMLVNGARVHPLLMSFQGSPRLRTRRSSSPGRPTSFATSRRFTASRSFLLPGG